MKWIKSTNLNDIFLEFKTIVYSYITYFDSVESFQRSLYQSQSKLKFMLPVQVIWKPIVFAEWHFDPVKNEDTSLYSSAHNWQMFCCNCPSLNINAWPTRSLEKIIILHYRILWGVHCTFYVFIKQLIDKTNSI
jgi:hypothetical protein